MFILIPTYHDKMDVQRLPVITLALVVICTIVQFITQFTGGTSEERIKQAEKELVSFCVEFPQAKLPEDVKKRLSGKSQDYLRQMRKYQEILGWDDDRQQWPPDIVPDKADGVLDEEREYSEGEELNEGAYPVKLNPEFQKRIENFRNAFGDNFFHKWGYIPAQGGFIKMITSMFIHVGWLHLIGNLLFLWLAGCALEDLWGRIFFPVLYVAGGIVALQTHAYMYPESTIACVGASGAIAALVGAFMIRLFKARIHFAWFALLGIRIRRGLFKAPAFIMLPLWFIQQLFWGLMYTGNADGGGIAFWAHIGGFAFGALAAITIKLTGLEKHVIKAAVDKKTNLMDESLSSGVAKLESGDIEGAIFDFKTALSRNLEDAPTRGLLARAYLKSNNPVKAAEQFSQCLHLLIKQENIGTAIDEYLEVTMEHKNLPLAAETEMTVIALMPAHDRQSEAVAAYERFIAKHQKARPADEAAIIARAVLTCSYLYLKELDKPKEAFLLLRNILKSGVPISADNRKKMIKIGKAAKIRAQKQAQLKSPQSVAENNPAETAADAPARPAVAYEKKIKLIQPVKSPPQINIGSIMAHELGAISLETDGIDVRILNHDIVSYDAISFICAFTLTSNNASELLAEVFAGQSGRPYRLFSNRINYKKFLQRVEMVNAQNFRKFLIEIVSRTSGVFADEATLKFLKSGKIHKFKSEDDAMGYKRNLWLQIVGKAHGH